MPKMTLSRAYTWGGAVYGPGDSDVPDQAAGEIEAREDQYQQYLDEGGEPHAPHTPGMTGGGPFADPRLRVPAAAQVPAPATSTTPVPPALPPPVPPPPAPPAPTPAAPPPAAPAAPTPAPPPAPPPPPPPEAPAKPKGK